MNFQSRFTRTYDLVVFGTGYAAFGSALAAKHTGRSVCLVSRQSDLLWESGRAFMPHAGESQNPLWRSWKDALTSRNAATHDEIDGALAEVIGTDLILEKEIEALYYSTPVDVERSNGLVEAVVVATKSGYHRMVARQWIDATESGEVIRLIKRDVQRRAPARRHLFAYYQHLDWPQSGPQSPSIRGADLTWSPTLWPRQRRLGIALPGETEHPRRSIIPALRALYETCSEQMAESVLSHCSLVDCCEYAATPPPTFDLPENLISAAPALSGSAITTLADRFVLGAEASKQLAAAAGDDPPSTIHSRPIEDPPITATVTTDILVAGAGTGGAYASIAGARSGKMVTVVEPYEFPGGIGAGGGIHWYYFGMPGGLQAEVDERIQEVTPLFGGKKRVRGFHPEARKLVLESMFDEAGVVFLRGALVCDAHREGRRVTGVTVATADGIVQIDAEAFIDATGDGDLSVQAGAGYSMGRQGDGLVHAYSQSGGCIRVVDGGIRVDHLNFDAGYTDPSDVEDLTRARLAAITQYRQERFSDESRWTYIAPAIGLRQSRQIDTDYTVTLADLIERRRFSDVVGYTGAHYDNHATDYEFESDEGLFWVWLCRQWSDGRTACEIPYRMMLPKGLDNVWVACRAAGVTQDAHHSLRMQRDLQRLGEVAGISAALSITHRCGAREIPFADLQKSLAATGALDLEKSEHTLDFGPTDGTRTLSELRDGQTISDEQIAEGLEALHKGTPSRSVWYLYRAGDRVQSDVVAALESDNPVTSWLAAGILALQGDSRAEPRLLNAMRTEEFGFDPDDAKSPQRNARAVPNWLSAISFLRCCGTNRTLPVLRDFAGDGRLAHNVRTAMALTVERLVDRGMLNQSNTEVIPQLLDSLCAGEIPGTVEIPARNLYATLTADTPATRSGPVGNTHQDYAWQLCLIVTRIRRKLGLPPPAEAAPYMNDERSLVRRAFARTESPD